MPKIIDQPIPFSVCTQLLNTAKNAISSFKKKQLLDLHKITWFPKPSGSGSRADVFFYEDKIFRAIAKSDESFFVDFFSCSLPKKLIAMQLMPQTNLSNFTIENFDLLIEQEQLPWIIYPQEWTFSMLQEAAKCLLTVNQICSEYGYETYDGHGFNILFNCTRPQFVDVGSFVKKTTSGIWSAMDEFIRCYLYPLKLWSQGHFYLAHRILSDNQWKRFYPEDFYYREGFEYLLEEKTDFGHVLQLVLSYVKKEKSSPWATYHANQALKKNNRFNKIIDIVQTMEIESAHDIGGNAGAFTRLLLENTNIKKCLCSDKDENAINELFNISYQHNFLKDKVSCVLLNILSPVHNYGHNVHKRLECNAIFALALLHHLLLVAQSPITEILNKLAQYTNKYIFIEFMPFSHVNVHSRVIVKEIEYYTEEWFQSEFEKIFTTLKIERLDLNRVLFIGEKNTENKMIPPSLPAKKKIEVVRVPVLLIIQDEQALNIFNHLKDLTWSSLLAVVNINTVSAATIQKLTTLLKTRCEHYEIQTSSTTHLKQTYNAINNFFNQFEYGIIIEDGFLPCHSFFEYCSQLLHDYRYDNTILQISGTNLINNSFHSNASYSFTRTFFGGAFATWRKNWLKFKEFQFNLHDVQTINMPCRLLNYFATQSANNWQFKWMLFGILHNYLSILPCENLVKFLRRNDEQFKYYHAISTHEMAFPLKHAIKNIVNEQYDMIINSDVFNPFLPFVQEKANPHTISIAISSECKTLTLHLGEKRELNIKIENRGDTLFSSLQPYPVNISYHWIDLIDKNHCHDGLRTSLISKKNIDLGGLLVPEYLFLMPNECRDFSAIILAPNIPGRYLLKMTVVQENQCWFDKISNDNALDIEVEVL